MDAEIKALIDRIRTGKTKPSDGELLESKFLTDTMIPAMRNKAAYHDHIDTYGNAGIHVHVDLNDFGQVNKMHGEPVGDKAIVDFGNLAADVSKRYGGRAWHQGGDEFKFWFLEPDHAHRFARDLHQSMDDWSDKNRFGNTHRMAASIGIGYNRYDAEKALQSAKDQLGPRDEHGHRQNRHAIGDAPTVVVSRLSEQPPADWRTAADAISAASADKSLTNAAIKPGRQRYGSFKLPSRASSTGNAPFRYVTSDPSSTSLPHSMTYINPLKKGDQHPLLFGRAAAILTSDNPMNARSGGQPEDDKKLKELQQDIGRLGYEHEMAHGSYFEGVHERPIIVYDPKISDIEELGRQYGQQSFLLTHNGKHAICYVQGQHAGCYHAGSDYESPPSTQKPNGAWTSVLVDGAPTYFSYKIDFDSPLKSMNDFRAGSHPHGYPWHEDPAQISYELKQKTASGNDVKKSINEQAATVGEFSDYPSIAAFYGHVVPNTASNLRFYDYRPYEQKIDRIINNNGYRVFFAGGRFGKPDLSSQNYTTGHLMIFDPTSGSGGDFGDTEYTRSWRKIHELAHALTLDTLNQKYGEGKRLGKLGIHRTPHEAMRAVEWEHLAAHKQRQLSEQVGHRISDEDFNREYNTVMHDAVHRAITGKFSDPSAEGFVPSDTAVPLEQSLKLISDRAATMGIGTHDTIKSRVNTQKL